MFLLLCTISFYISVKDIKTRLITNKSLTISFLILLAASLLEGSQWNWKSFIFCLAITPFGALLNIGAGDLKLLALLALFFIPFELISLLDFLAAISAISAAVILIQANRTKSLRTSIAFGPVICASVIWCARSCLFLPQ